MIRQEGDLRGFGCRKGLRSDRASQRCCQPLGPVWRASKGQMPLDASLKSTANLVPEFFKELHGTVGALLPILFAAALQLDHVLSRCSSRPLLPEPNWYRKLSGSVVTRKPNLSTTSSASVVWKPEMQFVVFFVVSSQANSV